MIYIEVAVSDGPGTLVKHRVYREPDMFSAANQIETVVQILDPYLDGAFTTLTQAEYQDFTAMHGGTIAV
jgi:hypothetical protein